MIGPLADSKADTEGSWMVFGHVPAAVTVLEGIRAKLGPDAKIAYAKGPEIKRAIPSFFDDFPGAPKPISQTPEEAEAAFQRGDRDGARRRPRGDGARRERQHGG